MDKRKGEFNMSREGFTLVELLVGVTIISIIAGIALVSFRGARSVARDSQRKAEAEEIRSALEVYRVDNGDYPLTAEGLGELITPGYMEEIIDPLSPTYSYNYESDGTTYNLCAYLEAEDPASAGCTGNCGSQACNYGVTNP